MRAKSIWSIIAFLLVVSCGKEQNVFIEAESFSSPGAWVVDQQGMDVCGSSWLLAHGCFDPALKK